MAKHDEDLASTTGEGWRCEPVMWESEAIAARAPATQAKPLQTPLTIDFDPRPRWQREQRARLPQLAQPIATPRAVVRRQRKERALRAVQWVTAAVLLLAIGWQVVLPYARDLWFGPSPSQAMAAEPAARVSTLPIGEVQPGMRLRGQNPRAEEIDRAAEPDPDTSRLIVLRLHRSRNPDCLGCGRTRGPGAAQHEIEFSNPSRLV